MGKQKKRNPFFYYMQERRPEIERRLNRKVTIAEMPQHVSADWQTLPDSKKNKYKMMCGQNQEKLDCRGVPLRQLEEAAQDQRRQAEEMKRSIAEMVDVYHAGRALHQATFFIVCTNFYVHTDMDHYVPAELSILQFSFKYGIMREFHETVKAFIPRSYAATARKHSQDTHNLLQDPDNSHGVTHEEMAENITKFLSNGWDEDVPLYTLHQEMEQTRQILATITGEEYKIYSLDMLFQFMYSAIVLTIPLSVATDLITECGLDFHPNISCPWHIANQMDCGRFCTLSTVRRWFYYMCQHIDLKNNLGVMPQEGKHYPYKELKEGVQRSMSCLTLEDSDSGEGASCDLWSLVSQKFNHSTSSSSADFLPKDQHASQRGKQCEDTEGEEDVWPWPTMELN
uniref:HMG box domain-containing protein n=1 Tax=Scylla olivacea TaxID=85551 RepID=A0A0P4WH67_SCYOL